jgi:hypothetical protein
MEHRLSDGLLDQCFDGGIEPFRFGANPLAQFAGGKVDVE